MNSELEEKKVPAKRGRKPKVVVVQKETENLTVQENQEVGMGLPSLESLGITSLGVECEDMIQHLVPEPKIEVGFPIVDSRENPTSGYHTTDIRSYIEAPYIEQLKQMEELEFMNRYNETKAIRNLPRCKPVRNSKVEPKIGRNEPCPCESGKKFKHCCINK